MSSPISYDLQGQGGGVVINDGDGTVTGNFRWFQFLNESTINLITSDGSIGNTGDLTGIIIPAGVGIGGRFTSINVSAGSLIAYYA